MARQIIRRKTFSVGRIARWITAIGQREPFIEMALRSQDQAAVECLAQQTGNKPSRMQPCSAAFDHACAGEPD